MMKSAAAYKRDDGWYVHSQSQLVQQIGWIATAPFIKLEVDAFEADLGKAILEAHEASQSNVPPPTDWNTLLQPVLKLAGVKSWAALSRGAVSISVWAETPWLKFCPSRNEGQKKGFTPLTEHDFQIPIKSTPEEVGAALCRAADLCQ